MSDDESEDDIYSGNSRSCHSPMLATDVSAIEWDHTLSKNQMSKSLINSIIMDYFVVGSFKDAAVEFSKESFAEPSVDIDSISDREMIRQQIINGDCLHAIELINGVNPSILESNQSLLLQLYQQHFVNVLLSGEIQGAIIFAKNHLAPLLLQSPHFLKQIEQMMTLVVYKDIARECPQNLRHKIAKNVRYDLADAVNRAILSQQGGNVEPALTRMMREIVYHQSDMKRKGAVKVPNLDGIDSKE